MDLSRSYSIRSPAAPHGPSLALAVACTGAMLAVAFIAGRTVPRSWFDRADTRPVAERITYVAPVTPVAPPAPAVTAPAGVRSAVPTAAPSVPAGTRVTAPVVSAPRAAPVPVPGAPVDTGLAAHGARAAGAAAAGGAARGPTLSPLPLRVGAELPAAPPLTREQRDSVLRAFTREVFGNPAVQAAAVAAAADAKARRDDEAHRELTRATGGVPYYHGIGLSIPFGGKTAEQRRRDSVVDADTRARLAHAAQQRARERADSIRRADSLRVVP